MCTSTALRKLARFLEDCEAEGAVSDVGLADPATPDGTAAVTATVELTLSTCGDVGLVAASAGEDGTLGFEFESLDAVVPATEGDVAVDVASAAFESGSVAVTLSASVPIEADGGPETTPAASGDAAGDAADPVPSDGGDDPRDADVPPFRNPDLLAEVYESCETFVEMADTLEMDVSAETVRRYMVDYDIHQPSTYDTGESGGGDAVTAPDPGRTPAADAGGEFESPVVLTDGIGLPEDVTVEGLVEAVERSATIHEATREIGVEREDAVAVLRELDLLDFVAGRLATEAERDAGREEILERLRAASAVR